MLLQRGQIRMQILHYSSYESCLALCGGRLGSFHHPFASNLRNRLHNEVSQRRAGRNGGF
jgi:hypothetical protein